MQLGRLRSCQYQNLRIGEKMKNDIFIEDLKLLENEIADISAVEKHYSEFAIEIKIKDDGWHTLRSSKDSRLFGESKTDDLVRKYGKKDSKPTYTFIHNSALWEEDLGETEYYGDGLDGLDDDLF